MMRSNERHETRQPLLGAVAATVLAALLQTGRAWADEGSASSSGLSTVLAAPPPATREASGDHMAMIGRYGVGLLGAQRIPDGAAGVVAPVIGLRRWLPNPGPFSFLPSRWVKTVGVEAGIGLGVQVDGGPDGDVQTYAAALHAGLPLALAAGRHFTFFVSPEAGLALSAGAATSFLFRVGARAGAEIHFGFLNLPEISLLASVGAGLHFEHVSRQGSATANNFRLGTTIEGQPWDIFTNTISALFYL